MDSSNAAVMKASGIENNMQKMALPFVFEYLTRTELLKTRLICKGWDSIISSRLKDKLIFKVCNNLLSIGAFQNLSQSFEVQGFQFEGFDLEEFFGNAVTFRRFSMGHCLRMTSLVIQNCKLSTSRFFELLAFCKNLKKLTLRNVPSIYQIDSGIGIFNWAFCFKSVQKNLAKIEGLNISEKIFKDTDIWGLTSGMRELQMLYISSENIIPVCGINAALKGCCKTLKSLIIRGRIQDPGILDIGTELQMKQLQKLLLQPNKNALKGPPVNQLDKFLKVCPHLNELRIQYCTVGKPAISYVQDKLIQLTLSNCTLAVNAFEDVKFSCLEKLRVFVHPEAINSTSTVDQAVVSLLKCKMPQLSELELGLPSEGSEYLRHLDNSNYLKLTTLSLVNCVDVAGRPLRKIFKDFSGLTSLSIKLCKELADDNLCSSSNDKTEGSLADMKNLKLLALTGTNVGNKTVQDCIVQMEKLEHIDLNYTQVNKEGLVAILQAVPTKLTSLKSVQLNCCKIDFKELKQLIRFAPNVKVSCSVIIADGSIVQFVPTV